MRPLAAPLLVALALTALPSIGYSHDVADAPSPPRVGWMPSSRVSIGARVVGRFGPYTLGGLGGQITLRLGSVVSVALFTDHMVGSREGSFRHDHEVGGMLQFRLLRGQRWAVFPMIGACANLAVVHAAQAPDASVNDIQFGARAGLGGELAMPGGFSLGAEVIALAYLGHDLNGWGWRAEASSDLSVSAAAQAVLHANYHF
jgi:hypothetical protein